MLTIKQVAERLNCSERSVRQLIYDGKLKAVRLAGIRIDPVDLDKAIEDSKCQRKRTPMDDSRLPFSRGDDEFTEFCRAEPQRPRRRRLKGRSGKTSSTPTS